LGVHRNLTRARVTPGKKLYQTPGVQNLSVQIVFKKAIGRAVHGPVVLAGADHDVVRRAEIQATDRVLAVFIEDLGFLSTPPFFLDSHLANPGWDREPQFFGGLVYTRKPLVSRPLIAKHAAEAAFE
jgi:hypothetical protein